MHYAIFLLAALRIFFFNSYSVILFIKGQFHRHTFRVAFIACYHDKTSMSVLRQLSAFIWVNIQPVTLRS